MPDVLKPTLDVDAVRRRFSSLQDGFAYLDAPGGSQVPDEVGEAIARALREASANLGAGYATSLRVKEILESAEARAARFLGCATDEVIFGPNMTSLNFTLSRTAGRSFSAGDEILVSSLDHDGGVAPWLELAHDRDLVVKHIELRPDSTMDYDDLAAQLSERTRVVAFAWASNAVGTRVDAARVCSLAHSVGALAWIVAVYGLPGMEGRVPTFLVNVDGVPAAEVARSLTERDIGVWAHDSWYSLGLYRRLGYEDAAVRIGFIHYNTEDEVDRLVRGLEA